MKNYQKLVAIMMLSVMIAFSFGISAQNPTFSYAAKNGKMISPSVFQFDVYVYKAGSLDFYLNNYQLGFKMASTLDNVKGGKITATYVEGSTQLPADWAPSGINVFNKDEYTLLRVNGCIPTKNGTPIPSRGIKIGTFQVKGQVSFDQSKLSLIPFDAFPAKTLFYAIYPASASGTPVIIPSVAADLAENISTGLNDILIFPNPVKENIFISFNSVTSGECIMGLYDVNGRQVTSDKFNLSKGANSHTIPVTGAASGVYLLKITVGDDTVGQKVIIE